MSEQTKKPLLKRWWFWLIAIFVIGGILSAVIDEDDAKEVEEKNTTENKDKEISEDEEIEFIIDNIEIEYHEDSNANQHMSVAGKTNLPDGEEVIISVISEENDYTGSSKDVVKDGIYVSEPFSKNGDTLPSGEYRVVVKTVEIDKAQKEKVIEIE